MTTSKGGRLRHVPLTRWLAAALTEHRHRRGERVPLQDHGQPLTRQIVQTRAKPAARRAGLVAGATPWRDRPTAPRLQSFGDLGETAPRMTGESISPGKKLAVRQGFEFSPPHGVND